MGQTDPVIEVEDLCRSLGEAVVLDGLTFRAPTGMVTGLLGPNGAGKTTTMRVLATLLRPDAGTVRIDGVDVERDPIEARRRIGLVTEEPGLYDRLTVGEQLRFTARAQGLTSTRAEERIEVVATQLGLISRLDERAGTLSKGNRQKVSLCRALVHDPPVLLLDEPTSGLDVVAAAGLEELLADGVLTQGRTVLLSTHRIDEAERLSQRIVGIAAGRAVVDADVADLLATSGGAPFRDVVVRMLGEATLAAEQRTA